MEGDYDDTPTTISSFNQNELRNLLNMIWSSIMFESLHQFLIINTCKEFLFEPDTPRLVSSLLFSGQHFVICRKK